MHNSIINQKIQDRLFKYFFKLVAIMTLLIFIGVIISLIIGAMPAIKQFGFGFLVTNDWDPTNNLFGGATMIYTTVVTSLIAIIIAIPISLGIVIFLTELSPNWLKKPLSIIIELLAAIPSIVYGIWGLFSFSPFLIKYIQEPLAFLCANIPVLHYLTDGPAIGIGILPASIILAIMIIPFITSVTRDVFEIVPPMLKESAYGLGATTWEVVRKVVIPYTKIGIIGAIILGLGRALGETMAVTFIIGNSNRLDSFSLFYPSNSITSILANEFAESSVGLHQASLMYLGLILFFITFVILILSKIFLAKVHK